MVTVLQNTSNTTFPGVTPNPFRRIAHCFQHPKETSGSSIIRSKEYFQFLLFRQKHDNFMKFPSVKALTGFLNVSVQDILAALNELRHMGFDYEIIHAQEAILVWDPLLINPNK